MLFLFGICHLFGLISIMFKLIIGFLGYQFFGFFGALFGFFIGSSIDRARNLGIGGINPLGNAQRQAVFLESVFVLMGKLAKADGHISKDEVDHVEDFIGKMGMTPEHRQLAIQQFKQGSAASDAEVETILDGFLSSCGQTLHLKQALLMYLIVMALADNSLDLAEEAFLEKVAFRLGYQQAEFKQLLEMVLNQSRFSADRPRSESSVLEAYKALGVDKDCSDQELKRCYRKLIGQHHPDKLMGQGLPEDMIKVATERAKEIKLAYDLIKETRGFK
jgi:DnaJ like chaperone protein|tara:strand:- start:5596 stop:6423 length:828 start_codon:yes stop_codon:yes gene_type:complete